MTSESSVIGVSVCSATVVTVSTAKESRERGFGTIMTTYDAKSKGKEIEECNRKMNEIHNMRYRM
jgi:hypothetical protein